MIVALLQAGEGDFAYASMKKLMPNKQKDYDLYKTEPYVYAEYLVGPGHPYLYGEGAFTWITGTAGWSFLASSYTLSLYSSY
jgi:N,N'-diacetylchitobiose phosphorylase